jgi:hypothetical protein
MYLNARIYEIRGEADELHQIALFRVASGTQSLRLHADIPATGKGSV